MHVSHMLYSFTFLLYSRKVLMYQSARPRFNPPLFAELWRNRGVNSVQAVLCCATPLLHLGNGKHDIISTLCSLSPSLPSFAFLYLFKFVLQQLKTHLELKRRPVKSNSPPATPFPPRFKLPTPKQTRNQKSRGKLSSAPSAGSVHPSFTGTVGKFSRQ